MNMNITLDDGSMKIERKTVKENPKIVEIDKTKNFNTLSNRFFILEN